MAAIPNPQPKVAISTDGLVTIVSVALLLLAIVFFNNDLHYRLDTKIDTVRTELKADIDRVQVEIDAVRTELKADIDNVRMELKADIESVRMELSADIQRVDDRLFAAIVPPAEQEETETP